MKKKKTGLVLLSLLVLLAISCKSVPASVDESLSEELFFKNAQEAMDENQYHVALYYYEVYLVRYPENHDKTIAAEYERALIFYKTKDYDYSKILFEQILEKYENSPFASMYPERYKTLSLKILGKIDKIQHPEKENKEEIEQSEG